MVITKEELIEEISGQLEGLELIANTKTSFEYSENYLC